MLRKIAIYDTTLRDGNQAQGVNLSLQDKIKIAQKLNEFGIDYIEGGWPNATNPIDVEFFKLIKKENFENSKVCAFGSTRRPNCKCEDDSILNYLIDSQADAITIFGKSWDLHVTEVIKTTLEENLNMISESIAYLKKHTTEVIYDAEHFFDGYKANPEYAIKTVLSAYNSGADIVALADTNGGTMPNEFAEIIKKVAEVIPYKNLGVHVHNDTGLAVANSMIAIELGVNHVQGVINGFGERCGNANLIPIMANTQLKYKHNVLPDDKMKRLRELSMFVYSVVNLLPNHSDSYTGKNAFTHKGGAHIDGVLKVAHSFEHINPNNVGNDRKYLVSSQSGGATILEKLNKIDPTLTKKDKIVGEILNKVKEFEKKGYSFEEAEASFNLLALDVMGKLETYFEILSYRISEEFSETNQNNVSEAIIKIRKNDDVEITADEGDGPVNALDKAVRKALSKMYPSLETVKLVDFKVRVLNSKAGTAGKVQVNIESTDGNIFWTTTGINTNLIEASWEALTDSLRYKLFIDTLNTNSL